MPPVARLGDPSDHGGIIIAPVSPDVFVDGIAVARNGDKHSCPIPGHGVTSITSTSTTEINGQPVIRVGDTAECGAVISSGSPTVSAT